MLISESDGLDLKRCPSSQFPPFASSASKSPLCPKPDDDDVQNGITPPYCLISYILHSRVYSKSIGSKKFYKLFFNYFIIFKIMFNPSCI